MQSLPPQPSDVVPWYRHVASTGSTNADLMSSAEDLPVGALLVADTQTAGVGRRERQWSSPVGTSISMSLLLDRANPWIPLIGGLALHAALHSLPSMVPVAERASLTLKWPNDVLFHGKKVAGILAQGAPDGRVVLGAGLNVLRRDLAVSDAAVAQAEAEVRSATVASGTSGASVGLSAPPQPAPPGMLDITGDDPSQSVSALIATYAAKVLGAVTSFSSQDVETLRTAYRATCETIGQRVYVYPPAGEPWVGLATNINAEGGLIVVTPDGVAHALVADEITHVRLANGAAAAQPQRTGAEQ